MNPTDDFTLWSQLLIDSLTAQIDYTSYISDSTDLLFSILDIGELPDPIKIFTKTFLEMIIPKSIKLLLQIPQKIEEDLDVNMGFFSAVLNVSAWAVQNQKSDIYQIIPQILDKNNKFYEFHPDNCENDQWKSITDLFFDCGTASIIFELLNNTKLPSFNAISCILKIIINCSPYKDDILEPPKNKIIEIFNNYFETLKNPNELKSVDENLLDNTFKLYILCASMKKWDINLTSFFEFIISTFKSEILEKQIFASTIFYNFLLKSNLYNNYLTQLRNWCDQSNFIQFLVGKDFNENVLPYLNSIFQFFSRYRLLPPDIHEMLWKRILQVHISQKEKYIIIIVNVLQYMPLNDVRLFFEKVTVNDNLYSDEVLKLVTHSVISLSTVSSQLASLLFRKSFVNDKVKTALFDSICTVMPFSTRKYIANLCFDVIEKGHTKTKQENESNEAKQENENENSNSNEQTNENSNDNLNLSENVNINNQENEDENDLRRFEIAETLLRKIISTFSQSDIRFISDFESKLNESLLYNRTVAFELIAQYNIRIKKALTTQLFDVFVEQLDDPLWNFFLRVFRSLGIKATSNQVFNIFPSIIEKYDFHQATLSFASFIKTYLLLFNLKENKIASKETHSSDFLPATFYFTHPPLIGTDILFRILTEANDSNVSTFITDVLFMFLTNFSNETEKNSLEIIKDKLLPIIISDESSNELKRRYLNLLYLVITDCEKNVKLDDLGYESHSTYKSQKVIVTIQDKKFTKRFLCDASDTLIKLKQRVCKLLYPKQNMFFNLYYKDSFIEDKASISFYDIVNNEITFHIRYNESILKIPDASNNPSVFLTNEKFQLSLFKFIKIDEIAEISGKLLDYLPNEISVVEMVADPSKVIEVMNSEKDDFYFAKYCLQTLVDQLIFGDFQKIKENYINYKFIEKLNAFCKEFKEKSDKVIYEILRIFYFLLTKEDKDYTNDLIAFLFNAIINNDEDIVALSAAYLFNKIVTFFPETDAIVNNLDLFEKVITKSNKDEWEIIRDTSKLIKNVNPIFEMILHKIDQVNSMNYQHFVDLFTLLITIVPTDIVTNDVFDKCVSILLHEKDQTFISLCEVAISIIDSNSELNTINPEIITQLLSRALQCDSASEQKASFNLCISLIEKFPSCLDNIHSIVFDLFKNPSHFWNYSPSQIEKKIIGYAGLTNLGATCYMNSVFQQLFNCTQFRDLLFQEKYENKESGETDDNGKLQIFNIFVEMLFGKKGFIETNEFCKTFKGWGKQLINTHEQQDAVEFMNLFLDQLPENLQKPFKGTFIHKITDVNNSICSSNEENFFALSLDIKHFTTIEESFNSFLKYELFTGENQIFSDALGTKIDAKKYTRIKVVPPNLVLHLKRFEYSRSTFNYIKIKSRFEVPQTIDITPLLEEEGNEEMIHSKSNIYSLKGVVLHEGNANSGHYISLVKNKDQWIKCNDKQLSFFNFSDFMDETFGGKQNGFCAYLLFYSREDENNNISIQDEFNLLCPSLKSKIEEENRQFLEQQSIFSKNMIYLASHLHSTEIMTDYFINIFTHSSNGGDSYVILERLKENIRVNQKEKWFKDIIITNFDSKIKPIYFNCEQKPIISALNELIETTFPAITKEEAFPLADIYVKSFTDSLSWRTFHYLLYIPLRFIKYYHINENEEWRSSITKKVEEFYQPLISEVVLEEVNLSTAFSILQRITPVGMESNLAKYLFSKKILESRVNYSSFFNFVVVTKQNYPIDSIIKYYTNMKSQRFNQTKYIRALINIISNSDFDASKYFFKVYLSIEVASMFLYYLRLPKPNLKEAIINNFKNCICPLLINFNDDVKKVSLLIISELFDTIELPSNFCTKDVKPPEVRKWIPKQNKEKNNEVPEGMKTVISQMISYVQTELSQKVEKYTFWFRLFINLLQWFLTVTKDFKVEYFNALLELFINVKSKPSELDYCYEYLVATLNAFPPEISQTAGVEYLQTICYKTTNYSSQNNSKIKVFLSSVLHSADEIFRQFFEIAEFYDYVKELFLKCDYYEAGACVGRIIEDKKEKIEDFMIVFDNPTSHQNYKRMSILLERDVNLRPELIYRIIQDFLKNSKNYDIISQIIPHLLNRIEKIQDFHITEEQISEDVFNSFCFLVYRKAEFKNSEENKNNLWQFACMLMNNIPRFKKVFCEKYRSQLKCSLIFNYFDLILHFEKSEFENEVTELLEVLARNRIEACKPEFNQQIINIVQQLDNLEILNNYFITILSHNNIYQNPQIEEMAKIILSKINDDQVAEAIMLLSSQFDTRYRTFFQSSSNHIFCALAFICEMKPDFYDRVISSIPFEMKFWANWGISERAKNILLSHDP